MKLLFLDESFRRRSHFVLCGVAVDDASLIPLERYLASFCQRFGLKSLKQLRDPKVTISEDKYKVSKELYEGLEDFHIKILASVQGSISMWRMGKEENYFGALGFILERYFYLLRSSKCMGLVILDSNDELAKPIQTAAHEMILDENQLVKYLRKRIYAPVTFCPDEYSHCIQLADLFAAGLQRAVYNALQEMESPSDLKGNE